MAEAAPGGFAPLRRPLFAAIWAAAVLGNTGSFMRDMANAWLAAGISDSPAAVALVQSAATLPVFLLSIPAGVLSDILDRRRFLIAVQLLLALVSVVLLVLSLLGQLSIGTLVALSFAGGVGAAMMGPSWQAIVPELVPRPELKQAVALNSLGINIARAIGPAIGGLLLAAAGAAAAYGTDVVSDLFVVAALLWWRRTRDEDDALAERFPGALRAGLRYARASRELRVVLLRACVFFAFSSAVWALLPLVARNLLGGGAGFYGMLLGAVGAGAILGALVLPVVRRRVDVDLQLLGAGLLAAAVMAGLALVPPQEVALLLLLLLGAAWITALTTLNGAAQAVLPGWVRGRGLSVYLTVFYGAMTAGSLAWGLVAQFSGLVPALLIGAAMLAGASVLFLRVRLPEGDADLTPSSHWPEPLTAGEIAHDRGPVLVLIEYRIRAADRRKFLHALSHLAGERRRDGAYAWGVSEDAAEPELLTEWFMVESWAEHLRQHRRVSRRDADVQAAAAAFHVGPGAPVVRHLLALHPRKAK